MVTPKRPYPDGSPSERERQEKEEGERFPSQIKKLTHLGGVSAARATILHQDGASKRRVSGAIARMAPGGQGEHPLPCLDKPQPAAICGRIDDALPIDSGTHHDNIGNPASILLRQEQNFLANDWKKKRRLKGAFLTVLRDRKERR